jgi:Putative transposase
LPDIPFVGIVLTMPDVFWPIFKAHRPLQHDLPALGAAVVQQWARNRYRLRVCVIVIQHTFGGRLNHNPHLHMMVSAGGLSTSEINWKKLNFDLEEIRSLWRFAVISYLTKANQDSLLVETLVPEGFNRIIAMQARRRWNVHITSQMSKKHFLGYAGRYIRRLPISQKRILEVTSQEVVYQSKDTRTNTLLEARCTLEQFVAMLSQHVLDRYQHSMRYFGLLSPRNENANLKRRVYSPRPAETPNASETKLGGIASKTFRS